MPLDRLKVIDRSRKQHLEETRPSRAAARSQEEREVDDRDDGDERRPSEMWSRTKDSLNKKKVRKKN